MKKSYIKSLKSWYFKTLEKKLPKADGNNMHRQRIEIQITVRIGLLHRNTECQRQYSNAFKILKKNDFQPRMFSPAIRQMWRETKVGFTHKGTRFLLLCLGSLTEDVLYCTGVQTRKRKNRDCAAGQTTTRKMRADEMSPKGWNWCMIWCMGTYGEMLSTLHGSVSLSDRSIVKWLTEIPDIYYLQENKVLQDR